MELLGIRCDGEGQDTGERGKAQATLIFQGKHFAEL